MHTPGERFEIDVPDAVLEDLQQRLARTRWPVAPQGPAWAYGTSLPFMREMADHWRERYDWRQWEARLNRHEQYRVHLDGIDIHVLVERGSGANPRPLILTHGWPGSLVEFIDMIEPLAHPERFGGSVEDAFTVVVPSLPGYGFSAPPPQPVSPRQVAAMWHTLMSERLGFERYFAHGGDWGAVITSWLGLDVPDSLHGIHLNTAVMQPLWMLESDPPSAEEAQFLERMAARMQGEDAYQQVHATKPQSLAYAMTDSPVGIAAWVLEKFHGWTVAGSDQPLPFDRDHLLTNVMMYWLGSANAASWMYRYLVDMSAFILPPGRRVEAPTAFCLFPDDIAVPPPDSWLRRAYDVQRCTRAAKGGHFPGLENGPLLIDDLRAFARQMNTR
jgi:microsomal epoxide hydrolase